MHNILIVEDNREQLKFVSDCIRDHFADWEVHTADCLERALEMVKESIRNNLPFTLFFLDVQLSEGCNDRGGFVLAQEIRLIPAYYQTPVLFLTAISDEGLSALSKYHCYNYIVKPYTKEDILFQIQQMLVTGYLKNALVVTDTMRIQHRVDVDEILYFESNSHSVIIHMEQDCITTREYQLKDILDKFPTGFVQCHRKYIINSSKIQNFDKQQRIITLKGRKQTVSLSVGRGFLAELEIYI